MRERAHWVPQHDFYNPKPLNGHVKLLGQVNYHHFRNSVTIFYWGSKFIAAVAAVWCFAS